LLHVSAHIENHLQASLRSGLYLQFLVRLKLQDLQAPTIIHTRQKPSTTTHKTSSPQPRNIY